MSYTVTGSAGKRRVKFSCSRCSAALESPLEEAGQRFPCPTCGTEFATPGGAELRRQQQAATDAAERRRAALAELERPAQPPASDRPTSTPPPSPPPDEEPHIDQIETPTLSYATSGKTGSIGQANTDVPEYTDIVRANRLLRGFARLAEAAGWLAILIGILALGVGVLNRFNGNYSALSAEFGLEFFAVTVAYALPCFVVALLLRTFGALAVAVRDIARNSFTR